MEASSSGTPRYGLPLTLWYMLINTRAALERSVNGTRASDSGNSTRRGRALGSLRVEIGRRGEAISIEARDVGDGIFMPICFVVKPQLMLVKSGEIPGLIRNLENNSRMDKEMKRRAVEVLKRHEGSDFNPYVTVGYRKVAISPSGK